MYGLEINQLANLLKESDPNRNDSDSEDDQVLHKRKKRIVHFISYFILAKKNSSCSFNSSKFCISSTKNC